MEENVEEWERSRRGENLDGSSKGRKLKQRGAGRDGLEGRIAVG